MYIVVTLIIVLACSKVMTKIKIAKAKKQIKSEHSKIWRAM